MSETLVELLSHIIGCVPVKVSTNTILSNLPTHLNLRIDEVRPAIHLYMDTLRQVHVDNFVGQVSHGLIHKGSVAAKADSSTSATRLSELLQYLPSVAGDRAQHAVHLDFASSVHEGAAHNDRCHRRVVCVVVLFGPIRCLEAALNLDRWASNYPEITFTVEYQA